MMGNSNGNEDVTTGDEAGRLITNKAQHEMQEPIFSDSLMIVGLEVPPPRPKERRHSAKQSLNKYRDRESEGSGTSRPPAVNDYGSNACLPNNSMEAETSHRPEVQIVHDRKSLPKQKQQQQQYHQSPSNSFAAVPPVAKLAASIPAMLSVSTTTK
jgi:hypothetical protein